VEKEDELMDYSRKYEKLRAEYDLLLLSKKNIHFNMDKHNSILQKHIDNESSMRDSYENKILELNKTIDSKNKEVSEFK